MLARKQSKYLYIRGFRIGSKTQVMRMSIIFVFVIISALISILLPIYFGYVPLPGG